jgi:hypothetical protein
MLQGLIDRFSPLPGFLVRVDYKLLVVIALAACGAPGSDAVFTQGSAKSDSAAKSAAKAEPAPPPRRRIPPTTHSGFFRVVGNVNQFQPCGTAKPLDVFGRPLPLRLVRERKRFLGVWEGMKLFAVLQGAVVTDTVTADGAEADSVKPGPRTRFELEQLDSLRSWKRTDCGGMRVP